MSLLEIRDLTVRFGGLTALDRVSFRVERGEIFSIIGPNGAGKSTLFNVVSRFNRPEEGDVRFRERSILNRSASEIAGLGIARTFQNIELFEFSSVLQNLLVARHSRSRSSIAAQILFLPSVRDAELRHRRKVEEVIDLLDLQAYRDSRIAGLPYGIRKTVELARALAAGPELILLDEPASGLSAEETRDIRFRIEDIRKQMRITVVMVEHDMGLVSAVSDRVLVLADGKVITIGTPAGVQTDPEVLSVYLGTEPVQRS